MLKIEQFDTSCLTLTDLEDLAEDEDVYSVYRFNGWKTDNYEVEPGYRIRPLSAAVKGKDLITKERICDSFTNGKAALIWLHWE